MDRLLTVDQVAEWLQVKPRTIYQPEYAGNGRLLSEPYQCSLDGKRNSERPPEAIDTKFTQGVFCVRGPEGFKKSRFPSENRPGVTMGACSFFNSFVESGSQCFF
jgi:hypothetical protein